MAVCLLNKYVWLVETIYKAKRITFEEFNEKWLENELNEGIELTLRTFHKWRIAVSLMRRALSVSEYPLSAYRTVTVDALHSASIF